jgi:hypothetical protein
MLINVRFIPRHLVGYRPPLGVPINAVKRLIESVAHIPGENIDREICVLRRFAERHICFDFLNRS